MEPSSLKKTPFREVPTAQNCRKKQFEIKILVVHDQNMTKPDANHDRGLAKTIKKNQENNVSTSAHGSKIL